MMPRCPDWYVIDDDREQPIPRDAEQCVERVTNRELPKKVSTFVWLRPEGNSRAFRRGAVGVELGDGAVW